MTTAAAEPATTKSGHRVSMGFLYLQAAVIGAVILAAVIVLAVRYVPPVLSATWSAVATNAHWPQTGLLFPAIAASGAAVFGVNFAATSRVVGPRGYTGPDWLWMVSTFVILIAGAVAIFGIIASVIAVFESLPTDPDAFY